MKFNYIKLKESVDERLIIFNEKNNLVYSKENSKGKTTLLRLLLYSLGFNIPDTKNIQFDKCYVETELVIATDEVLTLVRTNRTYIEVKTHDEVETYALPGQEMELHMKLFGASNADLIHNILGVFYFDQEKGWVLLNKGVVINGNSFKADELIRGINGIDCTDLIAQKRKLSKDLDKYKQMFSVSKYKETLDRETSNLIAEPYDDEMENEINQCRMRLSLLKNEMSRIDKIRRENEGVKKYIEKMGIMVKLPNDEVMVLSSDKIIHMDDTIDYLKAKMKLVAIEYNQVKKQLISYTSSQVKENQQLSFFEDTETIIDIFDASISNMPIDSKKIQNKISKTKDEIKAISDNIKELTKQTCQETINSILESARKYMAEMDLDEDLIGWKTLLTSGTGKLSGAILHKAVFALRLACLVEVQKYLEVTFPIILDSPRGKEIDQENVNKMLNVLKRHFKNNQLIIASIYPYELDNLNMIELKNRLIE